MNINCLIQSQSREPSVVSLPSSGQVVIIAMQIQMEFVPNHGYKPFKMPQQQQQQQPKPQMAVASNHVESSGCFRKGSYIELSNGAMRRVEDIRTEDFIQSALRSQLFDLREATVVRIDRGHLSTSSHVTITFSYDTRHAKVNMDVLPGHPLFVYGQGWASCNPQLSFQLYELKCQQLQVGDICLSLVPREQMVHPISAPPAAPPPPPPPQVPMRHQSYQMYAEMANFVAAYTQHVIEKLRN
ncbi:ataxin-1-like [Drosophila obscura]|uniref:ataxin-1-like n=1 Tax=Drosophila obscura TaxID=7282 RepID=UPI001BB1FD2B|nr:ataxin-1-like [Drosophila obscura]